MSNNFVVSTSLGSKNIHSIQTLSFTSKRDLNVVCIKGSSTLCIYLIKDAEVAASSKGKSSRPMDRNLYLVLKAPIQGIVVSVAPIRLKNSDLDSILIFTAKNQISCLSWDHATNSLKTDAVGSVGEMAAKPCKTVSVKSSRFQPTVSNTPLATASDVVASKKMVAKTFPIVGIHQYQGLFKVIPTTASGFGEAFNVRLEPLDVLDWIWLDNTDSNSGQAVNIASAGTAAQQPYSYVLAVLHQNMNENKTIDTYTLNMATRELLPWKYQKQVDVSALFMIPIDAGGFVLVGENYVQYLNPLLASMTCSTTFRPAYFTTYCMIDESRYLLADADGILYVLVLFLTPSLPQKASIYVTALGITCVASSISYISDGYVLVGGQFGDSQLIQLLDDEEEGRYYRPEERLAPPPIYYKKKLEGIDEPLVKSSIRLVQNFPAMGPISDFCVVEKHGQGVIVACCGAYRDSSLRVIRNGIGMHVYGKGGAEGCLGIQTVALPNDGSGSKSLVVVCLIDETRILESIKTGGGRGGADKSLVEAGRDYGMDLNTTTLSVFLCAKEKFIVQTSYQFIRIISAMTLEKVSEWRVDGGDLSATSSSCATIGEINKCCVVDDESLAVGVGSLVLFFSISSNSGALSISKTCDLGDYISCLAYSSSLQSLITSTWSSPPLVHFIDMESFQISQTVSIPSPTNQLVYDLLAQKFDEEGDDVYILASMGDGDLFYFTISVQDKQLTSTVKKTSLGTRAASLHPLSRASKNGSRRNGRESMERHVFACSDRSAVIHHQASSKLLFSSVNMRNLVAVAPFYGDPEEEEGLVVASEEGIVVGALEAVQKLHVKKIEVGETCRRIVEWGDEWFAVVSVAHISEEEGARREVNRICLFDATTFEVADRFELMEHEHATSLLVSTFTPAPFTLLEGTKAVDTKYLIVGTGIAEPGQDEPLQGRMLVFAISQTQKRQLELVHEFFVAGCVYSMVSLHGKLIAGINAKVTVYDWSTETKTLCLECTHYGYVIALYLATRGDMIIVGDLMKSVSCLFYDAEVKQMTLHARDFDTRWMTSVETLGASQVVLGADNFKNVFTLQKDPESRGMIMGSRFHLGELVNRFKRGSLVMKAGDSPLIASPTLLYCTVSGSIGVISTLDDETFATLDALQNVMRKLESVGMLSAEQFRTFETDRASSPSRGVIDGDLIESFADLSVDVKKEICAAVAAYEVGGKHLELRVEDVSNLVAEISRLH